MLSLDCKLGQDGRILSRSRKIMGIFFYWCKCIELSILKNQRVYLKPDPSQHSLRSIIPKVIKGSLQVLSINFNLSIASIAFISSTARLLQPWLHAKPGRALPFCYSRCSFWPCCRTGCKFWVHDRCLFCV